ncbi:hypothetical protein LCGC14_0598140 [marine sediment metagenome]|uniref:Uncharacterized protein n=1 Tax=marine sediment metagenome TaxID=412755 RepID=A0A0F9RBH8_9ZZZZ
MKRYKVTVHCDDIVAIVLAEDEDDAIDKYYDDNIEEYLEPVSQPDFTAELESKVIK